MTLPASPPLTGSQVRTEYGLSSVFNGSHLIGKPNLPTSMPLTGSQLLGKSNIVTQIFNVTAVQFISGAWANTHGFGYEGYPPNEAYRGGVTPATVGGKAVKFMCFIAPNAAGQYGAPPAQPGTFFVSLAGNVPQGFLRKIKPSGVGWLYPQNASYNYNSTYNSSNWTWTFNDFWYWPGEWNATSGTKYPSVTIEY